MLSEVANEAAEAVTDGQSELRWRELVNALPAAVYVTDAAGRITFYNDAAAALWGCNPEIGKSTWCGSWKLYWPDGTPLPHDECPMAVTLQTGRPVRGVEAVAERPDGTRVPFMPYPTPLHDASGKLVGAVNMLVDLTESKRARTEPCTTWLRSWNPPTTRSSARTSMASSPLGTAPRSGSSAIAPKRLSASRSPS